MTAEASCDLWFLFGSLCYGFECRVQKCAPNSIVLSPLVVTTAEIQEAQNFLDSILKVSSHLVKIEVQFFPHSIRPIPAGMHFPLKLSTTRLPIVSSTTASLRSFELFDLVAELPEDQSNWVRLVNWAQKFLLH